MLSARRFSPGRRGGKGRNSDANPEQSSARPLVSSTPAVIVTGASTGIGRATALFLAHRGFRVFAGVRQEVAAEGLRCESPANLKVVQLDVTDGASIREAITVVCEEFGHSGIAGLVNNAGIGVGGPLEFIELDAVRRQLDVNVLGVLAVTKGFLPLLRAGRGRIINIGSGLGRMVLPLFGPYCASKSALAALTDALRMELESSRLPVCLVEPGVVDTPMHDKARRLAASLEVTLPPEGLEVYGRGIRMLRRRWESLVGRAMDPQVVASTIHRAMVSRRPKPRYVVGLDARAVALFEQCLPDRAKSAMVRWFCGL